MGFEENRMFPRGWSDLVRTDPAAEREAELTRQRGIEARRAEAEMAHELANLQCPEDIKEFGRRHGIPNFAEVVWNAGFFAGYRQRIRDDGDAA